MNERKRFQRIKLPRENEGTAAMAIDGEREERGIRKRQEAFSMGKLDFCWTRPINF